MFLVRGHSLVLDAGTINIPSMTPIITNTIGIILCIVGIIEYDMFGLISHARHPPAIVEQTDIIIVGVEI